MAYFPLATVSEENLRALCQVLWNWASCTECRPGSQCDQPDCSDQRFVSLDRFFRYYKDTTATYGVYILESDCRALRNHDDLLKLIEAMKEAPNITREELRSKLTNLHPEAGRSELEDQEQAIDIAVAILLMVDCSLARTSLVVIEYGSITTKWEDSTPLSGFINEAFPKSAPIYFDNNRITSFEVGEEDSLTAYKLKKRCRLSFSPTDDLCSHLRIVGNRVKIFRHTAYVKEQLRLSRDTNSSISGGMPPRQLLVEVLNSMQLLLFRPADIKSYNILHSLVSRSSFDADCLNFESAALITSDEAKNHYEYFGSQVRDLYTQLKDPKPRGLLGIWLEQRSGARYVMLATLIGVAVAILLGIASLGVTIYQAWVGYQAWQHPVSPS